MAYTQFSINNISAGSITYQGVTIDAGNSYTPGSASQYLFALDPGLISDLMREAATITVGTATWGGDSALKILSSSYFAMAPIRVTSSATVTSVSGNASNVTLLSSNSSRISAYFFNDSSSVLYLKFGATASSSSFTVKISSGGFYELPVEPVYTGEIDGIWATATGAVRITETV